VSDRRLLFVALVLVAAGLLGMALGAGPGGWGGMHGPMMGWSYRGITTGSPIAGAPTVTVDAIDFAFRPDIVGVAADRAFNLTLVNRGRLLHDLSAPALGVVAVAPAGETVTVGVAALRSGRYELLCTVPGHAAAGMTGVLIVGDPDTNARGD
jgi:plastocyanin